MDDATADDDFLTEAPTTPSTAIPFWITEDWRQIRVSFGGRLYKGQIAPSGRAVMWVLGAPPAVVASRAAEVLFDRNLDVTGCELVDVESEADMDAALELAAWEEASLWAC